MFSQLTKSSAIYAAGPAKGWRPWGVLVPFLGLAFVVVSVGLLQIALQHANFLDTRENPIGLTGFATFLVLPFTVLGLVILAWVRFVERRPLASIGLASHHLVPTFLRGHLTGIAMAMAIVAGIWIAGDFTAGAFGRAFASPQALAGIALLLGCFALQSSMEELLFRGWMLSAISIKFGVVIAVAVSSAVFTLLHYDPDANWLFVTNAFLFGVFACCWSLKIGNIWAVMGWHAGWNWAFATGFELRVTSLDAHEPALFLKLIPIGSRYFTGGAQGPEASLVCTFMLVGALASVMTKSGSQTMSKGSTQT
jgi:membrane protease YdiL (CAAX protease family)